MGPRLRRPPNRNPQQGAARSVLLGEMLQSRVSRREDLQKALDNMTADDPARENTEAELQELGAVIKNLKEEQTATRRGTKAGHSSRQERDKPEMGGRLAYIKERSRKRAEKHRLSTQQERTEKNLRTQLTWARRFDQPGAGRKEKVFPLAEKELKDEKAAAPLFSGREKRGGRQRRLRKPKGGPLWATSLPSVAYPGWTRVTRAPGPRPCRASSWE